LWDQNPTNTKLVLKTLKEWEKQPMPVYSWVLGHDIYFQNYAFSYWEATDQADKVNFLCLDLSPRDSYPGSVLGGLADYHGQTKEFLEEYLKGHQEETVMVLTHYPLLGIGGVLHPGAITGVISKYKCKGYNFGGHTHRNHVTIRDNVPVIETESVSQIELFFPGTEYPLSTTSGESIRVVQIKNGGVDYSTTLEPSRETAAVWPSPFFTYTYASYPAPGTEVVFTAHFAAYHGFKTAFDWDFGDQTLGSGSSAKHSYSLEGEYAVTLKVTTRNLVTGEEKSQTVVGHVYVHDKHVISHLPSGLNAVSLFTGEDLTQVPKNTYQPTLITKSSSGIAIAELEVHFEVATEDIDMASVVVDVDIEEGKSVVYMPIWPEEVDLSKQLFIPSTGTGTVYICLEATSLVDVSIENADLILDVGETQDGITVTTTFYNGREYYLVSGVTDTGGGELKDIIPPTTTREIGEPEYVDPMDKIYVTSATPFTLTAEDNPGGTGVESIFYRIYDSGWLEYSAPFYLTGLSDGEYSIEYYSTDTIGNTEPTHTFSITLDNSGPLIAIENPPAGWALQDGVTFIASASDSSGTHGLNFSIREANGDQGIPVGFEDIPATYDAPTGRWSWYFNTLQLPDGHYIVLVNAEDNLGHTASTTVPYSIRNWAVLECLPSTPNSKAGRTMPVKFALRVAASVDPAQPFVYNEELTVKVYATDSPSNILQTSTFGVTSRDYRIDIPGEKYITNFKTLRTPKTYMVEIWRKDMLIGSFTFETVE